MTGRVPPRLTLAVAAVALLAGCQPRHELVLSTKSAVELRTMQTRAFDTRDRNKTLRTIIATLQDLGYNIDKVEAGAGTVTATKLAALRLTATVYARGETQTIVRANAQVSMPNQNSQVDDPTFYQQLFFEPLAKAMFLAALDVQDAEDAPAGGKAAEPPKPAAPPPPPAQ